MNKEELVGNLSPLNEQLIKVKVELQTIFDKKREFKDIFVQEHSKHKVGEVLNEMYKIHDVTFSEYKNDIQYHLEKNNGATYGGYNENQIEMILNNELEKILFQEL